MVPIRQGRRAASIFHPDRATSVQEPAAASPLMPIHQRRRFAMARILIGTSGWHYESWRGPFSPKGLLLKDQLQFYASQFATTELEPRVLPHARPP
jgi:hypothetical protein